MVMLWRSLLPSRDRPVGGSVEVRRRTVLVVQREELIRYLISEILESDGYDVVEACDAIEALAVIRSLGRPVDLLISDVTEPGIVGAAGVAQRLAPSGRVLLVSLGQEEVSLERAPAVDVLRDPFRADALEGKVREMLRRK